MLRARGTSCVPALLLASSPLGTAAAAPPARPPKVIPKERPAPTLLWAAIQTGDVAKVQELLRLGADPNARGEKGQTPLLGAIARRQEAVARVLIQGNADLSAANDEGLTPLQAAFVEDLESLGLLLLGKGADFQSASKDGWTPLHAALRYGKGETASLELIRRGAKMNCQTSAQWTPLHMALRNEKPEAARALIARGVPLEARNQDGWTPLMIAARYSDAAIIRLLLEHGADLHARSTLGRNALWLSMENPRTEITGLLLERGARADLTDKNDWTPLLDALEEGRPEAALRMLEAGADPSAVSKEGWSPLMKALRNGMPPVVRALLDRSPKLETANKDGWDALMLAARYSPGQFVGPLLERGASPATRNRGGWTALMLALRHGSAEDARLLLEKGADPTHTESEGLCPMLLAAEAGNLPILEGLAARKAPIAVQDKQGRSVLHFAAAKGRQDALAWLLPRFSKLEVRDKGGLTPLLAALKAGQAECAALLLAKGADPTASGSEGNALRQAAIGGNVTCLELVAKSRAGASPSQGPGPLFAAGSREAAAWLAAHGWDPKATTTHGVSGLHTAAAEGRRAVAEWFLDQGLDLNAPLTVSAKEGITPLLASLINNHGETALMLVRRGARLDAGSKSGDLPFHMAATKGMKDVMEACLSRGVDVNGGDAFGRRAVHFADSPATLDYLVSKGARLQEVDTSGATPLHHAAAADRHAVVESLLQRGLDGRATTQNGDTPLHFARSKKVADLLTAAGARLLVRNRQGRTPLEYARYEARPKDYLFHLTGLEEAADKAVAQKMPAHLKLEPMDDPNVKTVDALMKNLAFDHYSGALAMLGKKGGEAVGLSLLRTAANHGLPEACLMLAEKNGAWSRTTPQEQQSRQFLKQAAAQGLSAGHFGLAIRMLADPNDPQAYDPRHGVLDLQQTHEEAYARLSLASAAGMVKARELLPIAAAGAGTDGVKRAQELVARWNGVRWGFAYKPAGQAEMIGRIPSIQFFETPLGEGRKQNQTPGIAFPRDKARCINWVVTIQHDPVEQSLKLPLTARYLVPDGRLLNEQTTEVTFKPGETPTRAEHGCGWKEPGNWQKGSYTLELFLGPLKVARCWFEVN